MTFIPSEFTVVYLTTDEPKAATFQKFLSDYIDTRQRNGLVEPNPQVQGIGLESEFCMALLDGQGDAGNSQKWNSIMIIFNPSANVHLADLAKVVTKTRHEKTIYIEEVDGGFVYMIDSDRKSIVPKCQNLEHLAQSVYRGVTQA